ncbi:hypothetical protein JQ612_27590 [Bradyrhizobium manausense]|uniref:glycosyltransferase family 25 protein n=1 Tax=Bradyrhizobium manausense TaxID=989370 RepID=UPI001BAD9EFA|nr:hypothetical protein [Bradyrhizobium manausense]MBR0836975.1 hypothetical protein [Bradyrhizobium manausense]
MQQLVSRFSHTFLINLPSRSDRWRAARSEFARVGLILDQNGGKLSTFPAAKFDDADGFPSKGSKGAFFSHLTILELAREQKMADVLICEDDLKFNNVAPDVVEDVVASIPESWDIIHFGYERPASIDRPIGIHRFMEPPIGSHLYAVNGRAFDRIIGYMKETATRPPGHPLGARMGRDATFGHMLHLYPDIELFLASPNLATQRSSSSDITPSWIDRTPLRRFADVMRSILR